MSAPHNILDHLADCVGTSDTHFPGSITKRGFQGSHGRSVTIDLLVEADDGETYRITYERQPKPRS